jgi:hypothetical protein
MSSAGSFENTRDLFGDLLGAKNAGVSYGNHFVSMELRIWCKHCIVYITSFHLHFHQHAHTLIRFPFLFTW